LLGLKGRYIPPFPGFKRVHAVSLNKPLKLRRIDDVRWEIPKTGRMRTSGLIYTDTKSLTSIEEDKSVQQVCNVAHLPGIVGKSLAMPDIHWGYGFPIGGVAAFDLEDGVVSPGGVGYDINCGVRLAVTGLTRSDVKPKIKELIDALFQRVPSGLGTGGGIRLSKKDMAPVLLHGAAWAVKQGWGSPSDLTRIEDRGTLPGADPTGVSDRAYERGKDQVGTLGSGNHFLEVGYVEEVFDPVVASAWGLEPGLVTLMVHSGSRGFGYQICDEFLARMVKSVRKEGLELPDTQLACTCLSSPLADEYLSAMAAAANYAYANRQVLMSLAKTAWEEALHVAPKDLRLRLVYDACHNIAKMERHTINGVKKTVCVHRKGATRAFPAGHPDLSAEFRETGAPVLIPGDMGRASYVLVGQPGAMAETFGSACHGAGRLMSRNQAVKATQGRSIERELADASIYPRWKGRKTLREEAPEAYKDVNLVVDVTQRAGLARKVARIRPMGVVKG
jgi:tRNA-splicing ligase RtcB (3'-phosphate/5'-hydroxy nucleic acid ligase)